MEAAHSTEMFVQIYQTSLHHILKDIILTPTPVETSNLTYRENIREPAANSSACPTGGTRYVRQLSSCSYSCHSRQASKLYTLQLEHCLSRTFNSYHKMILCVMYRLTVILNSCSCVECLVSRIIYGVKMARKIYTLKRVFIYSSHVKSKKTPA
jgi:hypothetical protein